MRGNHFESVMGVLGFGESHGKVMGVVLEDVIAGVKFPLSAIQRELDKRRPGKGDFESSRQETDQVEVLSGVLDGITTGMPICLIVKNRDQHSKDYENLKDIFRPGHAEYSWYRKFKVWDWRGGGRASGRETIARVAAGAAVMDLLGDINLAVYPVQIGSIKAENIVDDFPNPLGWVDRSNYDEVLFELSNAQQSGDSLGGVIEVKISGVLAGLGDPVFGKLDAKLASALISIGGVKGIEFGQGFNLAAMKGSEANDQMDSTGFLSNNCGGILGGVSTGEEIILRLAVKPTSSIGKAQRTIDKNGTEHTIEIKGRHDTTIVIRILPVVTAMIRLVLADCLSYQKLVKGEARDLGDFREALDKLDEDILISLRKRAEISKLTGIWKKENECEVLDKNRETELMTSLKAKAENLGLNDNYIEEIWKLILIESKRLQK